MKCIEEIPIKEGRRVIVRVDWNTPLGKNGEVLDISRIKVSLKTINFLIEKRAKIILISHLGDGSISLKNVFEEAKKIISKTEMFFLQNPFGKEGEVFLSKMNAGEIVLFENLRFWDGEKNNDEEFVKKLASLGDFYINEAFSSSHRNHASIVGIPRFLPSFCGFYFEQEYKKLSELFKPEHPFLFILGGAKLETKLPLVEKFLEIADYIFIGGKLASNAVSLPIVKNPKIFFPLGDINALDANEETLKLLEEKIKLSKFILWNGPLGNYENGYKEGTLKLAHILSSSSAKVIVGGGDTENLIDESVDKDKFYFVSLSGGAMLEFLSKETLPGIEALN